MNDSKQATATIAEFLTARLDEEDSLAWQAALASGWDGYGDSRMRSGQHWVASYHVVKRKRAEGEPLESRKGRELADCGNMNLERAKHIAHHDPAHALADIAAKRAIIEFHKQWPVLVETSPKFDHTDSAGLESVTFRMSQQIMWATEQEYRDRFGDEPPTTPIMRALASVYAEHPDYRQEWKP